MSAHVHECTSQSSFVGLNSQFCRDTQCNHKGLLAKHTVFGLRELDRTRRTWTHVSEHSRNNANPRQKDPVAVKQTTAPLYLPEATLR